VIVGYGMLNLQRRDSARFRSPGFRWTWVDAVFDARRWGVVALWCL